MANLALTGDATNVESLRGNLVGCLLRGLQLRAHLRPVPVRNDHVIPTGYDHVLLCLFLSLTVSRIGGTVRKFQMSMVGRATVSV